MTKPFQELLERLGREATSPVTICYQSATQGFKVKQTKVQHADTVVEALTEMNANVWYEINPSTSTVRARAEDVEKLSAVWIDIDYKETGIQSEENASSLVDLLSDLIGVSPTAVVRSGHGLQPYWAIDPEEEYTQEQAAGVLARWGAFVRWVAASQGGSLDSVFDLPRIFRAPGSTNFKDSLSPIPVSVDFPEAWRPLSLEELNDVLDTHGFTSLYTMPEEYSLVSGSKEWEYAEHDCHWVSNLFSSVRPSNGTPKSRHGWLLQQLIKINAAHRNGCLSEGSAHLLVEVLDERFRTFLKAAPSRPMNQGELESANLWAVARVEAMTAQKLKEELKSHKHDSLADGAEISVAEFPVNNDRTEEELAEIYNSSYGPYGRTDTANSFRMVHFMQNEYKHVTSIGWYRWSGSRYVRDEEKSITRMAIDAARFVENTMASQDQIKWAEASQNKDRLQNAITIASTDSNVIVSSIDLDANANELCTPEGIVNLETGEIRPAIKGIDLNTKQTSISPAKIDTPKWNIFLKDTLEDQDRIMYVQELFGAALFGDARYHVLPVFVGSGANGKSTIINIMEGILNDYAATMPENFLLDTTGNAHPTDIARLRGVRFAVAQETRPDGKFNESRVKMLTGGDVLSARFMGQNFFDFKPTHTLFMAVNHLPEVKSGGDGFWRRLRKIDFRKTIAPEKRKEGLAQELIEQEGPGILQWMIEGAVRVSNVGFNEPESVKLSTQSYRHEEDHIAKFLEEKVIVSDTSTAGRTSVYNAYQAWCIENGEKPVPQNGLVREIKGRLGVTESSSAGFKVFLGIELMQINSRNNSSSIADMLGIVEEEKDDWYKR
jgi:P4 family phage/plasmid primase-like protien